MQRWQQIPKEYRSHPAFSEVWHAGGDAYTAVAVAKKTGTGSWVVCNIFRDHLGTITHLKNGSTIDEYSFDACGDKLRFCKPCETKPLAEHIPKSVAVREGRRRDKDNWSYTLSGEPALFADRGFTGTRSVSSGFGELCEAKTDERTNPAECSESGKFLEDFNLYNMNGRLYDPVLGRFLSPDPYIADPSFTQSYNRYSYVLNNPLKYNDPTGELPGWALWGIASAGNWLLGGMDNWINKGMSFKQSFSTANNPIVFSGNYHPGSNSWSNTQASAQQLVGSMANAEQGVHSNITGFSGMGRYGEGPLFTSTPLPQFVGESPLAYGVAAVKNVDAVSGATIDAGPYEGRYWRDGMPTEYYVDGGLLVVSERRHTYINLLDGQLKSDLFSKLYSNTPVLSRNYRFHPVNMNMNKSMGIMTSWSYFVLDAPLIMPSTLRNAEQGYNQALEFSRINYQRRLLRYYRSYNIIK